MDPSNICHLHDNKNNTEIDIFGPEEADLTLECKETETSTFNKLLPEKQINETKSSSGLPLQTKSNAASKTDEVLGNEELPDQSRLHPQTQDHCSNKISSRERHPIPLKETEKKDPKLGQGASEVETTKRSNSLTKSQKNHHVSSHKKKISKHRSIKVGDSRHDNVQSELKNVGSPLDNYKVKNTVKGPKSNDSVASIQEHPHKQDLPSNKISSHKIHQPPPHKISTKLVQAASEVENPKISNSSTKVQKDHHVSSHKKKEHPHTADNHNKTKSRKRHWEPYTKENLQNVSEVVQQTDSRNDTRLKFGDNSHERSISQRNVQKDYRVPKCNAKILKLSTNEIKDDRHDNANSKLKSFELAGDNYVEQITAKLPQSIDSVTSNKGHLHMPHLPSNKISSHKINQTPPPKETFKKVSKLLDASEGKTEKRSNSQTKDQKDHHKEKISKPRSIGNEDSNHNSESLDNYKKQKSVKFAHSNDSVASIQKHPHKEDNPNKIESSKKHWKPCLKKNLKSGPELEQEADSRNNSKHKSEDIIQKDLGVPNGNTEILKLVTNKIGDDRHANTNSKLLNIEAPLDKNEEENTIKLSQSNDLVASNKEHPHTQDLPSNKISSDKILEAQPLKELSKKVPKLLQVASKVETSKRPNSLTKGQKDHHVHKHKKKDHSLTEDNPNKIKSRKRHWEPYLKENVKSISPLVEENDSRNASKHKSEDNTHKGSTSSRNTAKDLRVSNSNAKILRLVTNEVGCGKHDNTNSKLINVEAPHENYQEKNSAKLPQSNDSMASIHEHPHTEVLPSNKISSDKILEAPPLKELSKKVKLKLLHEASKVESSNRPNSPKKHQKDHHVHKHKKKISQPRSIKVGDGTLDNINSEILNVDSSLDNCKKQNTVKFTHSDDSVVSIQEHPLTEYNPNKIKSRKNHGEPCSKKNLKSIPDLVKENDSQTDSKHKSEDYAHKGSNSLINAQKDLRVSNGNAKILKLVTNEIGDDSHDNTNSKLINVESPHENYQQENSVKGPQSNDSVASIHGHPHMQGVPSTKISSHKIHEIPPLKEFLKKVPKLVQKSSEAKTKSGSNCLINGEKNHSVPNHKTKILKLVTNKIGDDSHNNTNTKLINVESPLDNYDEENTVKVLQSNNSVASIQGHPHSEDLSSKKISSPSLKELSKKVPNLVQEPSGTGKVKKKSNSRTKDQKDHHESNHKTKISKPQSTKVEDGGSLDNPKSELINVEQHPLENYEEKDIATIQKHLHTEDITNEIALKRSLKENLKTVPDLIQEIDSCNDNKHIYEDNTQKESNSLINAEIDLPDGNAKISKLHTHGIGDDNHDNTYSELTNDESPIINYEEHNTVSVSESNDLVASIQGHSHMPGVPSYEIPSHKIQKTPPRKKTLKKVSNKLVEASEGKTKKKSNALTKVYHVPNQKKKISKLQRHDNINSELINIESLLNNYEEENTGTFAESNDSVASIRGHSPTHDLPSNQISSNEIYQTPPLKGILKKVSKFAQEFETQSVAPIQKQHLTHTNAMQSQRNRQTLHGKRTIKEVSKSVQEADFQTSEATHNYNVVVPRFNMQSVAEPNLKVLSNDNNFYCGFCDLIFPTKWEQWLHVSSTHVTSYPGLVCKHEHCRKVFISDRLRRNHEIHHEVQGDHPNSCEICVMLWKTKRDFFIHLKKNHPEVSGSTCGICLKMFPDLEDLKSHVNLLHKRPIGNFEFCQICARTFTTEKELVVHAKIHVPYIKGHAPENEYIFKCDICTKSYKKIYQLWKHVNKEHEGHPLLSCPRCLTTSATVLHLHQHKIKYHATSNSLSHSIATDLIHDEHMSSDGDTAETAVEYDTNHESSSTVSRPHKCKNCSATFHNKSYLDEHSERCLRKSQNEVWTSCKECHKTFNDEETFTKHQKNYHSSYKCHICPEVEYASKVEIINHNRVNHVDHLELNCTYTNCAGTILRSPQDLQQHLEKHLLPSFKELQICIFCGDTLPTTLIHNRHIVSAHKKLFSLTCFVCYRMHNTQHNLLKHVETEHYKDMSTRNFCRVCAKVFTTSSETYDHIVRRHGTVFAACYICLSIFDTELQLSDHVETVHETKVSNRMQDFEQYSKNKTEEVENCRENLINSTKQNIDAQFAEVTKEDKCNNLSFENEEVTVAPKDEAPEVLNIAPLIPIETTSQSTDACKTNESCLESSSETKREVNNTKAKRQVVKRDLYEDNGPSQCISCCKVFSTKSLLWRHYVCLHKRMAATTCGICLQVCPNYNTLQIHLDKFHLNKNGFSVGSKTNCKICGKYYRQKNKLNAHMMIHDVVVETNGTISETIEIKQYSTTPTNIEAGDETNVVETEVFQLNSLEKLRNILFNQYLTEELQSTAFPDLVNNNSIVNNDAVTLKQSLEIETKLDEAMDYDEDKSKEILNSDKSAGENEDQRDTDDINDDNATPAAVEIPDDSAKDCDKNDIGKPVVSSLEDKKILKKSYKLYERNDNEYLSDDENATYNTDEDIEKQMLANMLCENLVVDTSKLMQFF